MTAQPAERLAQIRARLAAATPGPWTVVSDLPMYAIATPGRYRVVATPNQNGHRYARPGETIDTGIGNEMDAAFIAAAPENIAWLIGEVERLRADYAHKCEMHRCANDLAEKLLDNRKFAEADRDAARAELAAAKAKIGMQPISLDWDGTARFKENAIVRFLLDAGPFTMNDLAVHEFSDEDKAQFAQLIGYSVSGWGDLSYVAPEAVRIADLMAAKLVDATLQPASEGEK